MSHSFPVYAPSKVTEVMGAQTGNGPGDPNATHHLTYWLETEDPPEKVVAFYQEQMKSLPGVKDVPEADKYEGPLLMFRCAASGEGSEKVERLECIVSKADSGTGTEFRVSERLKPGLKYPQ